MFTHLHGAAGSERLLTHFLVVVDVSSPPKTYPSITKKVLIKNRETKHTIESIRWFTIPTTAFVGKQTNESSAYKMPRPNSSTTKTDQFAYSLVIFWSLNCFLTLGVFVVHKLILQQDNCKQTSSKHNAIHSILTDLITFSYCFGSQMDNRVFTFRRVRGFL